MSDESKQKYAPEHSSANSEDALAQALAELVGGSSLRDRSPLAVTAGACPELGEWILLASGEAHSAYSPPQIDALLAHAAACPVCAPRLRQSLRLFMAEATPEESTEAAQLASATVAWQRRMAADLAHSAHWPTRRPMPRFCLWGCAALLATILLAFALNVWWRRVNAPERLLAEVYAHSRSFDLRIHGAGYSPLDPRTHLRGEQNLRESSKLLEARSRIERRLEHAPDDPHWLQLEARADILEEKFDPAIDILDRLLASGPVTSGLLADDAFAYFQRGSSTGSEDDRATALDYLRRADELTPSDPVVLFNEAIVMEDRGQVMNAVETWNRYLRFERDPHWLAEGRNRLHALEQKLDQLKTHQSRMEQHLATPRAMRALAADPATLAGVDEEFSSTLLPRLLDFAFPLPVDRSRGSPCDENCLAARTLLHALAASLERNHQDTWLTQFLPSDSAPPKKDFLHAAHALAQAIDAYVGGDFSGANRQALQASRLFHRIGNTAGEDWAEIERSDALQAVSDTNGCYRAARPLFKRDPQFAWIHIHSLMQETECDPASGTATESNPLFLRAIGMAQDRHYLLLELRARNLLGGVAVDSEDTEAAWRSYLATIRRFYSCDLPAWRLYTTLSGLQQLEQGTPRVRLALLLQREVVGVIALTGNRRLIPVERLNLAAAAIRAASIPEAEEQMRLAQSTLAADPGGSSLRNVLMEEKVAMASLYLDRHDLSAAKQLLDAVSGYASDRNAPFFQREYAVAHGELELEQGNPKSSEAMLRSAIIEQERLGGKSGAEYIAFARENRDLYAVLAGVWLAQGRSGEDILALWERYRLRILGRPVPVCADMGLACMRPKLASALERLGADRALGQVVLLDRTLLYQANKAGVLWSSIPIGREDVLAAAAPLNSAVTSPSTSQETVDRAARRVGNLLLTGVPESSAEAGQLLIEPDPLLGNLPWPAVETAAGPLGLRYDLEEAPSLLLDAQSNPRPSGTTGASLVVGASQAAGEGTPLPEVLQEAEAVARFDNRYDLLLGAQATEAQVIAKLAGASSIHFAGHAVRQEGATRLLLAPAAEANSRGATADPPYLDSDLLRKHPPRAARLVVFSACSTGKEQEGWNHGMSEIVETLAALGVPEVVSTRWQIDSSSAVPLMEAFYGGLAHGLTVPRALAAARRALLRDPHYRHPYYWAAYYASGTGRTDLSQLFHGGAQPGKL